MEEENVSKVDVVVMTTTTIATFTTTNMRCQKFDDQDLHTLLTHQKEVLDKNAIWL
jgi:hypothetical protein